MSNDVVIRVENLSKLYKIGARQEAHKTFGESIMRKIGTCMKLWTCHNRGKESYNIEDLPLLHG